MRIDRKSFLLRISPAVLAAVQRLAAAELRSVNTEVEILLREALGPAADSTHRGGRCGGQAAAMSRARG